MTSMPRNCFPLRFGTGRIRRMAHGNGSPPAGSSVTTWLEQLKQGDSLAAQQLWQRYLDRLVRLARQKLGLAPRRVSDEEDVALSAFHGFLMGVEQGRFARLEDRHDLWQVLVMITQRKAIGQKRRQLALKRGGRKLVGESAIQRRDADTSTGAGMAQVPDHEPTPQFADQVGEQLTRLLDRLGDDELRRIALAKMEAYNNREIAAQLNISLRAAERKLSLIRRIWLESPT